MNQEPHTEKASPGSIFTVLTAEPNTDDGRSEWMWFRLPNGDRIFGTYPRGDTYFKAWEEQQHSRAWTGKVYVRATATFEYDFTSEHGATSRSEAVRMAEDDLASELRYVNLDKDPYTGWEAVGEFVS